MNKQINEPETGNKPGVYEIENREGEKVRLVAQNFPQADAFVRMNAEYIMSLQEWKEEQIKELKAKSPASSSSDKKGK